MKILCFGAHPSDIEVSMGGTIVLYTSAGHTVKMVVVTSPNKAETRKQEAIAASQILGTEFEYLDLDSYSVHADRHLVGTFDMVYGEYRPDIVYTHWVGDSHQGRRAVAHATISATRKNACSVFMYESTGGITTNIFRAQMFVGITKTMRLKAKALGEHKTQIEADGWFYGVTSRAQYRGYQIGPLSAEACTVART